MGPLLQEKVFLTLSNLLCLKSEYNAREDLLELLLPVVPLCRDLPIDTLTVEGFKFKSPSPQQGNLHLWGDTCAPEETLPLINMFPQKHFFFLIKSKPS